MAGLISLVVDNISKLIVIPIISLIIIGITYFMDKNNDSKIAKFYPSFIIGIVGLVLAIVAIFSLTSSIGLNLALISVILLSNSLVGIFFAFILNLTNNIKKDYDDNHKKVRKDGKK